MPIDVVDEASSAIPIEENPKWDVPFHDEQLPPNIPGHDDVTSSKESAAEQVPPITTLIKNVVVVIEEQVGEVVDKEAVVAEVEDIFSVHSMQTDTFDPDEQAA